MTANTPDVMHTDRGHEAVQDDFGILIRPDALFHLITSLSRAMTAADIADVVVEHCGDALGACAAIFSLYDERSREFHNASIAGYPQEDIALWRPFSLDADLPMAECAREKQTILYNSNSEYVRAYPRLAHVRERYALEAHVAAPILLNDNAIGAIDIGFATKRVFTETDRALMKIFGEMCAQALERAKLYESERQARRQAQEAIEARRLTESALERVHERYNSLFDESRDAVAIGLDGHHAYVNQAYARLFGYAAANEIIGRPITDLTAPAAREEMERRINRRIAGEQEPTTYIMRGLKASGAEFDVEIRVTLFHEGERIYTLGIARDITAERRARQALTESERKFRTLFEQNAFGTAHTSVDRKWLTVNQKLCDIFGYTREELMALRIDDLIHPTDFPMTQLYAGDLRRPNAADVHITVRCVRKDRSIIWVKALISPLIGEEGELEGFLTTAEDVTTLHKANEERERLSAELAMAYERERRIAESLQRSLLLMPPDQELAGLEVLPVYWAAYDEAAVGGDFYDAIRLGDDRIALVIGDISGKGLSAAARTAEVKFTVRAFLREDPSPASALQRLNRFLAENRKLSRTEQAGEFFVCLCICIVNTQTGECRLAVAGMEPAIVFRPRRNALANWDTPGIEHSGLPLGTLEDAAYAESTLTIGGDDVLLMTTDGLTDAHPDSTAGEFFGSDGLVHVARRLAPGANLDDLGKTLLAAARAFAGGRIKDDTCLILARLADTKPKPLPLS